MFSLIACCLTLNVLLENDVKNKWGNREGVYTFQGFSDGMDYWVDSSQGNTIWYKAYVWRIAPLQYLGSTTAAIYTSSITLEKNPF